MLQVIEIIGKENVKLSSKQIDELIELIDKEEILEVEDKIEKALKKDKDAKKASVETDKGAKELTGKECEKSEHTQTEGDLKDLSSKPTKPSKMESSQTMVTPPPSIEKTKDSSKML